MSCPHASTTTLAWCYGEADDGHGVHVATCEECRAVVEDAELVMGAVTPLAPALSVQEVRRPRWGAAVVVAVALAAVALLAVRFVSMPSSPPVPASGSAVIAVLAEPAPDFVDLRIDALELELDALSADPSLL